MKKLLYWVVTRLAIRQRSPVNDCNNDFNAKNPKVKHFFVFPKKFTIHHSQFTIHHSQFIIKNIDKDKKIVQLWKKQ